MEKSFETEVLTRLAVIESKIDDYKSVKEKSDLAYSMSKENEEEINKINDKITWITKTILGSIITGIAGIVFILIQIGVGIK